MNTSATAGPDLAVDRPPERTVTLSGGVRAAVLAIFLLSGIAGLVYEVIWTRMLQLVFGVTSLAAATVIGAFMTGLALGSYFIGRRSDNWRHPLRAYAVMELFIGLYALLSPALLGWLDQGYALFYRSVLPSPTVFALLRFAGSFLVIVIPTTMMGGTLPVIVRAFVRVRSELANVSGRLYAVNTLGATIGCFLTGFFFIKYIGLQGSIWLAAGINFLVAVLGWLLPAGIVPARPASASDAGPASVPADGRPRTVLPAAAARYVIAAYALSGLAGIAYEVLWIRALIHFFGTNTYTFTTVLTTFLAGIAIGSLIFARLLRKTRNSFRWFAVVQIAIGLLSLGLTRMIEVVYRLGTLIQPLFGTGWWANEGIKFGVTFAIMIIPASLMGGTLPLVFDTLTNDLRRLGNSVGRAYAANTVGGIIGSLLAGFVLMPLFGIQFSLALVVAINVVIGAVGLLLEPHRPRWAPAAAAGACLLYAAGLLALADRSPVIMFHHQLRNPETTKLLYSREGESGTIAVYEDVATKDRFLNINGQDTALTEYQDMQIHRLLAHLALLVHPQPQRSLIVGFGLGSTCWGTVQHPDMLTDCVELMPYETETAQFFLPQNHGVLGHPRFNLIIGDGRDHIKVTSEKYDMVSFNAVHPTISPNLYTLEFYELCKRVLTPDGILVAWITSNHMNETEFRSLIRTFQTAFPHTSYWYINPTHMLLLGTPERLTIDWGRLTSRMAIPDVRADLAQENLDDPYVLLSLFVAADEELARYVRSAPLNTDDFPRIEFTRSHGVKFNENAFNSIMAIKSRPFPLLSGIAEAGADPAAVQQRMEQHYLGSMHVLWGQGHFWKQEWDLALEEYAKALQIVPGDQNALYLQSLAWRVVEKGY